jgi:hypothetical protein
VMQTQMGMVISMFLRSYSRRRDFHMTGDSLTTHALDNH